MTEIDAAHVQHLRRERDLYRQLLELGGENELEPLLKQALALVVDATGAQRGYLEVEGTGESESRWSIAHGLSEDEVAGVRSAISRGIIAEALATGQTIVTASAVLDPRFRNRGSVQHGQIDAVLCAPIGTADPPLGVLYLQGRVGGGTFCAQDRELAELFARHLAPLADRLLTRSQHDPDPTAPYREQLRLESIVGRSPALAALLRQVALVAPLDINVLLTGESGTGKSHVARVIHDNGPRAGRPFVEVNCAAMPDTLLENELFGHVKGGFTDALADQPGRVRAAEGGTLFLDEVGELSLSAQPKLLHLLHARQYYPLGASKPLRADVRVIAASNADLEAAVAERRFREDLFYRLQVLPIRVPALAERREDIPELVAHFCAAACDRHNLAHLVFSRGAVRAAQSAEWPGNVRQLAHAVEAAVIRAAGERAPRVERAHLFPEQGPTGAEEGGELTFQEATRRFQERLLRETLEDSGWNIMEVVRRLDIARSHVYNLIRAFGIARDRR